MWAAGDDAFWVPDPGNQRLSRFRTQRDSIGVVTIVSYRLERPDQVGKVRGLSGRPAERVSGGLGRIRSNCQTTGARPP